MYRYHLRHSVRLQNFFVDVLQLMSVHPSALDAGHQCACVPDAEFGDAQNGVSTPCFWDVRAEKKTSNIRKRARRLVMVQSTLNISLHEWPAAPYQQRTYQKKNAGFDGCMCSSGASSSSGLAPKLRPATKNCSSACGPAGGSPDRFLMTARKWTGLSGSHFVIVMGNKGSSNVVGRVKAIDRTSKEFQVQNWPQRILPLPYVDRGGESVVRYLRRGSI